MVLTKLKKKEENSFLGSISLGLHVYTKYKLDENVALINKRHLCQY